MKKIKNILFFCGIVTILFSFASCKNKPEGAVIVSNFEISKYLGSWSEIARLDHSFERGMTNTTAEYTLNEDGSVKVLNRGYITDKEKWNTAEGIAKFRGEANIGELKVSFFGPFYGGYNIIELDPDYNYALVAGPNLKYLWILARTTTIPENIKTQYLNTAQTLGYAIEELIWVEHDK
ncbi:MAG TPA: lipocalin family protein [Treponemataceae bacterium]|nr:lipocalin family protein [Treponemataceae bacterium]